jgi:hypothetical protein
VPAAHADSTSVRDANDVEHDADVIRLDVNNGSRAVIFKTTFAMCEGAGPCPDIDESTYYLKWSDGMCRHRVQTTGVQGIVECRRGAGAWQATSPFGCATSSTGRNPKPFERVKIPRSCIPRAADRLRFRVTVLGDIDPGAPEMDVTSWTGGARRG